MSFQSSWQRRSPGESVISLKFRGKPSYLRGLRQAANDHFSSVDQAAQF
jgi:hypothetical protein